MCTLIVATRQWHEAPLVVLANRDEHLDRPAAPPRRWNDRPIPLLAPEDLKAGGTWWGLSARGVFAGITNRFAPSLASDRISRGVLVLEALTHESAAAAANVLNDLPGDRHNPFHLVVADRKTAHLIWSDGTAIHTQALRPGIAVFTERSLGAAPTRRPARVEALLNQLDLDRPPRLEPAAALLANHADDVMEAVCVHADDHNYGTRSSTYLRMGRDGDVALWHADGRPCVTPFADHSPAARELLVG